MTCTDCVTQLVDVNAMWAGWILFFCVGHVLRSLVIRRDIRRILAKYPEPKSSVLDELGKVGRQSFRLPYPL